MCELSFWPLNTSLELNLTTPTESPCKSRAFRVFRGKKLSNFTIELFPDLMLEPVTLWEYIEFIEFLWYNKTKNGGEILKKIYLMEKLKKNIFHIFLAVWSFSLCNLKIASTINWLISIIWPYCNKKLINGYKLYIVKLLILI